MTSPSTEPVIRSRLLPRVSFRSMLLLMTLAAVLAAVARAAGSGKAFALGVLAAIGMLAVCAVVFSILFLFAWSVSSLWYSRHTDQLTGSPFAADRLPPQILPPSEQEK